MRNAIDFSSWQGVVSTLLGLILMSVVAVGIRLLVMHSVQQRRERQNRQINERLKTLIAAYKTLGGSFTGDLAVDPSHLRGLRRQADAADAALESAELAAGADALLPDVRAGWRLLRVRRVVPRARTVGAGSAMRSRQRSPT